ncbi:hypothetical protein VTN31DRAFT_477 [Thermomyces dupontii]|uniref:uncharacterized protein n=1 Tax=Talaromyces thermophilus TaxID=28565 RepID=UPI0037438FEE
MKIRDTPVRPRPSSDGHDSRRRNDPLVGFQRHEISQLATARLVDTCRSAARGLVKRMRASAGGWTCLPSSSC